MIGTERIVSHIRDEAQAEQNAALAQAGAKAAEIAAEFAKKAQAEADELLRSGKEAAEQRVLRADSTNRLEARKDILGLKQGLVTAAFDKARQAILALDEDKYVAFLAAQAGAAALTGSEEVVLKEYDIPDKDDCPLGNPWARVFNAAHTHKYDTHDNEDQFYNTQWLKSCETEAQLKLNAYGTLSINEVYDMLGFVRVPEGQVFGWVKGDKIDFGVFSSWTKPEFRTLWENDMQRTIVLNFNVGKEPITKFIKKVKPNDLEEMDPVALELWSQQNK